MNCPVCDQVRMREVEKDGVMIDVCPSCKGVWLDRGELEKITQGLREEQRYYDSKEYYRPNVVDKREVHRPYPQHSHNDSHGHYGSKPGYPSYPSYKKYKKKKSMIDILGDLF